MSESPQQQSWDILTDYTQAARHRWTLVSQLVSYIARALIATESRLALPVSPHSTDVRRIKAPVFSRRRLDDHPFDVAAACTPPPLPLPPIVGGATARQYGH